mgnify:CR=1 FL=1
MYMGYCSRRWDLKKKDCLYKENCRTTSIVTIACPVIKCTSVCEEWDALKVDFRFTKI